MKTELPLLLLSIHLIFHDWYYDVGQKFLIVTKSFSVPPENMDSDHSPVLVSLIDSLSLGKLVKPFSHFAWRENVFSLKVDRPSINGTKTYGLFPRPALAHVLQNSVSHLFFGSKKLVNRLTDRLINKNLYNNASNKCHILE